MYKSIQATIDTMFVDGKISEYKLFILIMKNKAYAF